VTYGSFLPRSDGARFPEPEVVRDDLAAMGRLGLNTVRTYDRPPGDVMAGAAEIGLRLLIGLDYPDWRYHHKPGRDTNRAVRDAGCRAVDDLMDELERRDIDPAGVLAVSVGNEVPADLVRVHGPAAVEDTLSTIVDRVHGRDRDMLVTYTNYPTTEYLRVDGQDLITFNLFLEQAESFDRYLRHLQVVSGRLPLVLTELGLAAEVHGTHGQAELLAEQLTTVARSGCAGATVFAWTDEWGVNDEPVTGWGFGITDDERRPKPGAGAVETWARADLKDLTEQWPRISVVVCAYNESRMIEDCLHSLERSDYPDLEVVVCNDGSDDDTLARAKRFPFTVLDLPRGGLSRARNAGIAAATGDIVAFLDADAVCHPQWPWFLALSFEDPTVSAAGGPNLPVPDARLIERAVALAPGAPTEVLIGDDRAEHIAGCNMAFRRSVITGIDGFDPTYTAAGDDVDVCWKLLDGGHRIGFNPAAQVVHHRRGTIRGYLRQQRGYGRAEKLLTAAHPARFNRLGQARWAGVIYGGVGLLPSLLRPRVYHGYQGSAPFQPVSIDRASVAVSWAIALLPLAAAAGAGGLVAAGVAGVMGAGAAATWLSAVPAVALGLMTLFVLAVASSADVDGDEPAPGRLRALIGILHVAQPLARTWGRVTTRAGSRLVVEEPKAAEVADAGAWTGHRHQALVDLERRLRSARLNVRHLDPSSSRDLAVATGPFTRVTVTLGVAWSWTPHVRTALRPRRSVPVVLLVVAGGWMWSPPAGAAVAGAAVAGLVVDAAAVARTRRIIERWHSEAC
jgi:GT2 family glycosyltransferase